MKRQAILWLAGILLLACSACGSNGGPVQSEDLTSPAVSQPADAAPDGTPFAESEAPAKEPLTEEEETKKPTADLQPDSQGASTVSVDVDLTTLSSPMVYAEVFNMMMSPDEYIGKTIRMTGIFVVYQNPETNQVYCGVIVEDAAACCAQGFELVMPEERSYPQDYPAPESEITVLGTLQADHTLEGYGRTLLRLEDVTFEPSAIS